MMEIAFKTRGFYEKLQMQNYSRREIVESLVNEVKSKQLRELTNIMTCPIKEDDVYVIFNRVCKLYFSVDGRTEKKVTLIDFKFERQMHYDGAV